MKFFTPDFLLALFPQMGKSMPSDGSHPLQLGGGRGQALALSIALHSLGLAILWFNHTSVAVAASGDREVPTLSVSLVLSTRREGTESEASEPINKADSNESPLRTAARSDKPSIAVSEDSSTRVTRNPPQTLSRSGDSNGLTIAPSPADVMQEARYVAAIRATALANWDVANAPAGVRCRVRLVQALGGQITMADLSGCPYDKIVQSGLERSLLATRLPYSGFESYFLKHQQELIEFCFPAESCVH